MIYKLLGDIVIMIHFLWILFILFGFLVALKWPRLSLVHVAGLVFALVLNVAGWYCPLTHLENYLKSLCDPQLTYKGSFIINRLEGIIYLDLQAAYLRLGAIAWVALNIVAYAILHGFAKSSVSVLRRILRR